MPPVEKQSFASPIRAVGRRTLLSVARTGRMALFLGRTLVFLFAPPWKVGRFVSRIRFIGFHSILVIVLTGGFTGMVLSLQGYHALNRFGSDAFLGPLVALSLIRELGPVITALMVTGRAGSAICAEIGIMRNGEQIAALELMGLSPFRYLVVPNLVGAVVSLPLLTAVFDVVGIWGGYLVGVKMLGVNAGTYFGEMMTYVEMQDITGGAYKALSFGGIISWVCCYKGYTTGLGAEGVSKATTEAVVQSSVLILVWDYFMTSMLF